MQLCVSNIAWAADQDQAAGEILRKHGIEAVEIAPTKYWPAPCTPTADQLERANSFGTPRRANPGNAGFAVRHAEAEHLPD